MIRLINIPRKYLQPIVAIAVAPGVTYVCFMLTYIVLIEITRAKGTLTMHATKYVVVAKATPLDLILVG